jgi:hypothetical protein
VTDAPTTDLSPADHREELDPELVTLPDPPKRERTATLAVLLLTALLSLVMVASLLDDALFAFSAPSPIDLGDLGDPAAFVDNRLVRGEVMLGAAHAIRYERPFASSSFRLMPASGHPNVWVEVHVPEGAENGRWVPPSRVIGRLVRFASAGPKHRGLAAAVREAVGRDVTPDSWLLVEGDSPTSARWAVLLVVMFAAFAAWNVGASARLLRRVT